MTALQALESELRMNSGARTKPPIKPTSADGASGTSPKAVLESGEPGLTPKGKPKKSHKPKRSHHARKPPSRQIKAQGYGQHLPLELIPPKSLAALKRDLAKIQSRRPTDNMDVAGIYENQAEQEPIKMWIDIWESKT